MNVKFGFTYELLLVAPTAHEMVAVVKGVADAPSASGRSLDGL